MTITITKKLVKYVMSKMYSITLNLEVKDEGEVLIDQDFTENHKTNNTVNYTLAKFLEKMQKSIDDYKDEINIFNSTQLDGAISTLEGQLNG